jgi:hypothetical protein
MRWGSSPRRRRPMYRLMTCGRCRSARPWWSTTSPVVTRGNPPTRGACGGCGRTRWPWPGPAGAIRRSRCGGCSCTSSARAAAAATNRARKLDRARDDLGRLERGLGSRHYPTAEAVAARIAAIGRTHRITGWIQAVTGTDPVTNRPTLSWQFDQTMIDSEVATDGWYALLTSLPGDEADAVEVLRRYKGQEAVERR